ncbi:MAG: NAD-dependent epimerase/dehydratase family protein, partial [Myxococcota bacterium]|nr:NAD-dependent epimerase/dehydratase family protein [Myxococcota bacterium]
MKTVLVTGGAGFVGSQTVLHLQDHGYRVVVIDDLSTGHRQFGLHADRFYEGCVEDTALLDQVLVDESVDGVIHCAARALVEESTREPVAYFQANVGNFGVLLDALVRHGTRPVVFSSSATVYGAPDEVPIEENTRTLPINPYGESKLAAERLLAACGTSYGLPGLSLRYFNAAGAVAACRVGEWRRHETHAIPNLIAAGFDCNSFTVCGSDWPT